MKNQIVSKIANDFLSKLREWLTPEEFADMVQKQATEPQEGVCYSHDYCDANMAMDYAMRTNGINPLPDDESGMPEEVVNLWNAAWGTAKCLMVSDQP